MKKTNTIKTFGTAGALYLASLAGNAFAADASTTPVVESKPAVQVEKPAGLKVLEARISQLTAEKRADIAGAENPASLYGKSSLSVVPGPNGVIDINVPELIEISAGDKKPGDFSWTLKRTVDGQTQQTTVFYKNGKIFHPIYDAGAFKGVQELDLSVFTSTETGKAIPFTLSAGSLIKPNKSKKILVMYKENLSQDLLEVFGGGTGGKYLYGKESKAAGVLDLNNYDGAYIVFNNAMNVGGKPELFAKVTPFYQFPGGIQKAKIGAENIERNLMLTAFSPEDLKKIRIKKPEDFEGLIDRLAGGEDNNSGSKAMLPVKFLRLNTGVGSRTDSVETTTTRRGVRVPGKDVAEYSTLDAILGLEGRTNKGPVYAALDAQYEKALKGDYDRAAIKARPSIGYLGNNLGLGLVYAISNESFNDFKLKDGFVFDKTKSLKGFGGEFTGKLNPVELRVLAEYLNGTEEQTLKNTGIPTFSTSNQDSLSAVTYEARLRAALGHFEVDGTYRKSNEENTTFNSEDSRLGVAARYRPKNNLEFGVGADFGTISRTERTSNQSSNSNTRYQKIHGGVSYRF